MITANDLETWLKRYGDAWVNRDPDAAAALFTDTAKYYETPFDLPFVGRAAIREYWSAVPGSQVDIAFQSTTLGVIARTGVAHWRASFTRVDSGQRVELDGVFMLSFDESALCTELREWWHRKE